ncbi:MobF family relaxase [Halomonas sp. 3A7M]|uniref:MobF family relaxase n=1 Tax=Halomonas sp. 3A7M TaxID=2742616 RepID=UPI001867DFEC|nr:MobF family relaxase [Halomonas sp. 3A7M]
MLDITTITRNSVGAVVKYYADGADDYYAKDGQASQWAGKGAESLGLSGEVDQDRFKAMLGGQLNETTQLRRVVKEGAKERLGYDLTFSAPKGVSLQALVHGDHRIIQAHDKAVQAAVQEAEKLALVRSTQNGKTATLHSNNLTVATFRHETSRAKDPDLHTHAFVLNATQKEDGTWRALTNDGIVNSLAHLGNVYKAELAKQLQEIDYQLKVGNNGTFDLAHFSEKQIDAFSQRSEQIEAKLAEEGLTRETANYAQRQAAALSTRSSKETGVDREELRKEWQKMAKEAGIDFNSREWAGEGNRYQVEKNSAPTIDKSLTVAENADRCIDFAIKSLTERDTIIAEHRVMDKAINHGFGLVSAGDVKGALDRKIAKGELLAETQVYHASSGSGKEQSKVEQTPALTRREWIQEVEKSGRDKVEARRLVDIGIKEGRLVKGKQRYTTPQAQARERAILQREKEGRGAVTALVDKPQMEKFKQQELKKPEAARLKTGQLASVEMIATSTNRFTAVHGYAGTGKSYMTKTAKQLLESNGAHVTGLAPYGPMVRNLQAEGMEARTVASFLKAADKKIGPGSVVVIDEAGVIPARQMNKLMETIEAHGARAVMLGDTSQTKAIEAGKPFDQLIASGMKTTYMDEIQRQKNPELLKAVELAAKGQANKSLQHMSAPLEIDSARSRHEHMAKTFTAQTPQERAESIMVTGTNKSRRELNEISHESLGLKGKGHEFQTLNREDMTQAERRYSRYYKKDSIIIPERDYKNGLKRGEAYTVIDTGPGNKLTVKSQAGEMISFSPARHKEMSIYSMEKIELSKGDDVRITRNVAAADLGTHEHYTVADVKPGQVTLTNSAGKRVTLDNKAPLPMTYGYATTVHSAQGLTRDRVYANLDSHSPTTTKEVYYVAVSRARHEVKLYTDKTSNLPKSIMRDTQKHAALDIKLEREVQKAGKEKEHTKPLLGKETSIKAGPQRVKQREGKERGRAIGR